MHAIVQRLAIAWYPKQEDAICLVPAAKPSKVRKPRLNKRMPLGSGIAKHPSKPLAFKALFPESSGVNEPLIVSSEIRLSQPRRAGSILPKLMSL